jgi:hypothetical protein
VLHAKYGEYLSTDKKCAVVLVRFLAPLWAIVWKVLSMHFPHYSPDVLCDILANNDGSLSMTLAILGQFEQELAAQQQLLATDETPPEPDAPPPKIDDEELFPSLGGATAGSSSGAVPSHPLRRII